MTLRPCSPHPARAARPGATTVEFAAVSGLFFLLVFGIVELGRGIMVVHQLGNAARIGCRHAIVEGTSDSAVHQAVDNNLEAGGINGATVTVLINDAAGSASNAQAGDEITVQISVPVANVTWLPGGRYLKGTLSGQYALRRE
jgi:Flp pilus assembly protein TadG